MGAVREMTMSEREQLHKDKAAITTEELSQLWDIAGEVAKDYAKSLELAGGRRQ